MMPIILSQILSNNFHIRTYVEATLLTLFTMRTQPYPEMTNGLNQPAFTENAEVSSLKSYIYSIIKSTIDEYEPAGSCCFCQANSAFNGSAFNAARKGTPTSFCTTFTSSSSESNEVNPFEQDVLRISSEMET